MRRAKRKIVDKFISWRRRRRGVVDGGSIDETQDDGDGSTENDDLRTAQLFGSVSLQKDNTSKPKRPLLSNLFRKGQCDQQDLTALQKSAENGNIRCQVKLGRLHLADACENASAKEGIEWLIKASKAQNVEATEVLKDCLINGLGIDQENRKQVIWCIKASYKIKKQVSEENLLPLRFRQMRFRRTSSLDDIDALREAELHENGETGIPLRELTFSKKQQNADDDSQSQQNADDGSQSQQKADDDHNKSAVDDHENDESDNIIKPEIQVIVAVSDGEDCVDAHAQDNQINEDCVDTPNDSQESIHEDCTHQVEDSASQSNHADDSNQDMDKDASHASEDDHIVPAAPPNSILDPIAPSDQSQSEMQDISNKDIVESNDVDSQLSHDENISHPNQNGDITVEDHSSPKTDSDHNVSNKILKATSKLEPSSTSNSPMTRKNCKKETHFGASSTVTVLKEDATATEL